MKALRLNRKCRALTPTRLMVFCLGVCLCLPHVMTTVAWSDTIHVAVASNFKKPFQYLAHRFEKESGHTLVISSGSSGKLFAQISHGAPFQLFLSADLIRPQRLQKAKLAQPDALFTYARGRLVLWSPDPKRFANGPEFLRNGLLNQGGHKRSRIALANPRGAPYGLAAKETFIALGLWDRYAGRLAFGENVGQVLAFVLSGNADAGFVALSQILDPQGTPFPGSFWEVPQPFYTSLEHGAVRVIQPGAQAPTLALTQFLRTPATVATLIRLGYRPP